MPLTLAVGCINLSQGSQDTSKSMSSTRGWEGCPGQAVPPRRVKGAYSQRAHSIASGEGRS